MELLTNITGGRQKDDPAAVLWFLFDTIPWPHVASAVGVGKGLKLIKVSLAPAFHPLPWMTPVS